MAESVILSAIERLDRWLLKKPDLFVENYVKLRSLLLDKDALCNPLVEMADLRKDIKEKLYSTLLVVKPEFGEDNKEKLSNFLAGIADFREDNMNKLHTLMIEMAEFGKFNKIELVPRHFVQDYKEELYSLLVGMADFRINNEEKMNSLLVEMADFWEDNNEEKLYSLLIWVAVLVDSGFYNKERRFVNKKKMYRLLVEMTDMWEDRDDGKLNKKKLHTLLHEITDLGVDEYTKGRHARNPNDKKLYSLIADIAGLCKNVKGKLNMVKVHSWLAKKADLCEHDQLFRLLLDVAFHHENKDAEFFIRNTVEGIKGGLRSILDFLRDKKLEEGSSLHCFVSDAAEMAHDAQILIDVRDSDPFIIFHIFNREDPMFTNQDSNRFFKKIRSIENWIQETKEHMLQFGVERAAESQELGGGEGVVVGLEEDIKLLLRIKDTHTTFIRGMAGIGKTTLASILYNHAAVVDEFECRAWVCVSWESSRKKILMKLIRQVVDNKEFERDVGYLEKIDNKGLKQMLHQHLQGMRYFIVLDDVRKKTFLKYILKALPKDKGSRLLLTTRSADVECKYETDYDHMVKFLDDDKIWQLFLKIIFFGTSDQKFPKHLEKRGRKMLTNCNGLPLAIKEVGRKWAEKKELKSEWEQLVESIDLGETLVTLESTYQNLDPQVKSYFLHLSFFKEGTTIRSKKLDDIWTVGGVDSEKRRYSKEIISELAKASIIVETPKKGRKTCRINAVFHKLSIQKAQDEMRLEILRNDGNNRLSDNPRHRVIYCSREKFTYSTNQNNNHLVSLFFRGGGCFHISPSYWKHFEQLKILDMEDFGLKILPDAVGTLIELRYLGLRNNYIQELPCSLSHLKNLEVLDIALNFMMEVSDIIWEIGSLCHLYMSDIICQKPMKKDALTNLQTLTHISVNNLLCLFWGWEMYFPPGLRKLGIEELDRNSDINMLFTSLAKLKKLKCLSLKGFRYRSMPSLDGLGLLHNIRELKLEGRLKRLPSADNFPEKIRYLTLVNSCLDEDPMPILENIRNLFYLKLQNAYNGQQMVISFNGFRCVHLVIGELWNLRNVEVGKGALRHLRQLDINSCPYLETLPEDIMRKDIPNMLNMVTTKNIAKKILESDLISKLWELKIQP